MPSVAPLPPEPQASRAPALDYDPVPQSFAEVIALFDERREALIRSHLWSHVHLVTFGPHRIPARGDRAARPCQPARAAAYRVDWNALGRRRLAR
jgi:DNA polymerase-3 subunit gamma/tau